MERILLTKIRCLTCLKAGTFWVSKKAKDEILKITQELNTFSSVLEEKVKWLFNKLKGKQLKTLPKTLPDLLRHYNISPGIFPKNIKCYEFDKRKSKLVVYLNSPCEVKFSDSSIIRYATRVNAILSRGKLSAVEGMKTKILVWLKVTSVNVDVYKSNKLWFRTVVGVKKLRSKDVYDMPRYGVRVK